MSREKQRELDEIYRPMNEKLFNNIEKQYQEIAKVTAENERIEEMIKELCDGYGIKCGVCGCKPCAFIEHCKALYNAGYRKQSEPISCGHEKGGEWVQLPCKVGDILYVITQMKDKRILPFINEYEVTSISINRKSIVVYHEMDGFIKNFRQCDFGKTIFLTREEAERVVTDINVGSK
jgi:hypothetical protein